MYIYIHSLIHKKLGDANLSLRKNIVDQILKLYHATCRNLTAVNDNLSKAQVVIEVIIMALHALINYY